MSAALKPQETAPVYSWGQNYDAFLAEAWPLIRPHWNEVGSHRDVLRLNPDHAKYMYLAQAGQLHILTVHVDRRLVGYLFVLIGPHPRDRAAILARDDIFYVSPWARSLRLGPAMIETALRYIDGKADIVMLTEKLRRRTKGTVKRDIADGYLARFGFTPSEMVWSKVLRHPHGGTP